MTSPSGAGQAAPRATGLETVEAFLNTLDERSFSRRGTRHTQGDALGTPAATAGWLAERQLVPPGTQASGADVAAVRAVRDALRGALLLRSGERAAIGRVNASLGEFPLRVEIGPDAVPRLRPSDHGIRAALAALLAAVAVAEASGTWKRLKICAAADCRWVFYDGSRNGGGRWCSMSACGNRDKTRAYRQRHQ